MHPCRLPLLILALAANSLSGMTVSYGGTITDYRHQDVLSSIVTLDPDPGGGYDGPQW